MEIKKALKTRKRAKIKKPKFKRQEHSMKKLKKTWRRPLGKRSKLRMKEKARGKRPSIGYRSPKNVRYLSPQGLREVRVSNLKEMKEVKKDSEIAILNRTLGKRKRNEMIKYAEQNGIKFR